MTKFSNKTFFFFQKIQLSYTTSQEFLTPYQNLEKTDESIPTNFPDRRTE